MGDTLIAHEDSNFRFDTDALSTSPSDGLISQVISVLRNRQPKAPTGPRMFVVDRLMDMCLHAEGFISERAISDLVSQRVSETDIIDLYVPKAAEILGDLWMKDEISFADVTIGALRLQSMVRDIADTQVQTTKRMTALVVLPEQEQHLLGASVAASQLERADFAVECSMAETPATIANRAILDKPDAVLFSCAGIGALATVRETVQNITNAVRRAPIFALGGSIVSQENGIKERTGVDIMTSNILDVVEVCRDRRSSQSRK